MAHDMLENGNKLDATNGPEVERSEALARSSIFEPSLRSLTVASAWLQEAQTVLLDLDYFLVVPNGTHSALFVEAAKSLGFPSPELVKQLFIENRGKEYFALLSAIYSGCGSAFGLGASEGQFYLRLNKVAKEVQSGNRELGTRPLKREGAEELLRKLDTLKKDFLICTGSFRSIAELELTLTGLQKFATNDRLLCADDLALNKYEYKYWSFALNQRSNRGTVGLDDRLDAAESMLKGGIERVIVVPKSPQEPEGYEKLKAEYPERLVWIESLVGL